MSNDKKETNYLSFGTPIQNKDHLVKALKTLFGEVEVYAEPQLFPLLNTRQQKVQDQLAEIAIRKDAITKNTSGIFFYRNKRRQFVMLVPQLIQANFNMAWVQQLTAKYLISMVCSQNESEKQEALEIIKNSSGLYQNVIHYICDHWYETRDPALEQILVEQKWYGGTTDFAKVFSRLKTGQTQFLRVGFQYNYPYEFHFNILIEAFLDKDPILSKEAYRHIKKSFREVEWLSEIAKYWVENPQETLLNVLKEYNYKPHFVPYGTIISLAMGNFGELFQNGGPEIIQPLLKALAFNNPTVQKRAWEALGNLQTKSAIEAFCQLVIQADKPDLAKLAEEKGYYPADLSQRALFFFLYERWDDYDGIDFDRRLLRVFYRTASAEMQRRLTIKVQRAGRVEYLTILGTVAVRTGNSQSHYTDEEAGLLVRILAEKKEWAQLWEQLFRLPVQWSIAGMRELVAAAWQPTSPLDYETFAQLKNLMELPLVSDRTEISNALNQGVLRAKVRVAGRVNDVAFAHHGARLALSTANQKVVVWDLEKAQQELLLEGFRYPIGNLCFTPDDTLIWVERPNSNVAQPAVFLRYQDWKANKLGWYELGQVAGSITALQAFDENYALTASRDGRVLVWDIRERGLAYELPQKIESWTASICLSHDKQKLALLHRRLELYNIARESKPNLVWTKASENDTANTLRHGAFSPDGQSLVSGRFNGELELWNIPEFSDKPIKGDSNVFRDARRMDTTVEGLVTLPDDNVLLLALSDGHIQYLDWDTQKAVGELHAPGERVTTMRISPDGAFMAVGDRNQHFTLWDLRLVSVYRLLSAPLALARIVHLTTLAALPQYKLGLSEPLLNTLKFIEVILRHRFRFDVEVADFSLIQSGEYDIELEG